MNFRTDVLKILGFAADFQNEDFCQNILKLQYNLDAEKIFKDFEIECKNRTPHYSDIECIKRLYALTVSELQQTGWFHKFPVKDGDVLEQLELPYLLINCYSFNEFSNYLIKCEKEKHFFISAKTLINYHLDNPCEESYFRKKIKDCVNSTLFEKLYLLPSDNKPIKFFNLGEYNKILYHHIDHCKTNPFIKRAQQWNQPLNQIPLYKLLNSDNESGYSTLTETDYSTQVSAEEIRFTRQRLDTCYSQACNFYKYLVKPPWENNKSSSHKKKTKEKEFKLSTPLFYSYVFLNERILPVCTTVNNILHIPSELLHDPDISLSISDVADILRYISFLPNIFLQQHITKSLFESLQASRGFAYILHASDDTKNKFKDNWLIETTYNLMRITSFYYPALESCFYLLLQKYCRCINMEMNKLIEKLFDSNNLVSENDFFNTLKKNAGKAGENPSPLYTSEHFKIINEFWSTTGYGVPTLSKYCTTKSLDFRIKQVRGSQYPDFFKYYLDPALKEVESSFFENWIQ